MDGSESAGTFGGGRLEVDQLSVSFGTRRALDEVSFTVEPGRVLGLLGPNGAGKTTAMRVLFGIVGPDAGGLRWRGRPVADRDRRRWGYMPQERGLYVKMKAREHLVFFGRLRGLDSAAACRRADELLAMVGLGERAEDKIEQLSGGMQQRVQLAATLMHDPDVVVLDEPFAGLDPVAVEDLTTVITSLAGSGRTVVFSSHQLDLVEDLCEVIVLVHEGRVVMDGDLAELKAASAHRYLRVSVTDAPSGWASELVGAAPAQADVGETVLALESGADPLEVLDRVRGLGKVTDFGLELPRLSQMFREAVRS